MTAQERKAVENKISELKQEMNDVHGSKCEVYSRVVGYFTVPNVKYIPA